MIPKQVIEKVVDTAKIEEVIGDEVSLKKRGVNMIGNCPFHNEKTPSFTVSPAKGIYKCFGCGEAGGVVNFTMKYHKLEYPQAIKKLAEKYNIDVPERELTDEEKKEEKLREDIIAANEWAQRWFYQQLHESNRKEALSYATGRFTVDVLKSWGIGFAPNDFNLFVAEATAAGYSMDVLLAASLVNEKNGNYYAYFINRLMFPVHSITGRVIGFTGRVMEKDSKFSKYMNSKESLVFNKSQILYGINQAVKGISKIERATIVEGNTDVMRLHEFGRDNTIAGMGTAFTLEHAKALRRHALYATIIMDGDDAGRKAALKVGELLLMVGITPSVVILPNNQDPDSFFTKENKEEAEKFLKDNIQDYISFAAKLAFDEVGDDPTMRVLAAKDIVKLISLIHDEMIRESYMDMIVSKFKAKHKINKKMLTGAMREFHKSADAEEEMERDGESLPSYLSADDKKAYFKYGFYEGLKGKDKNQYFFGPGKRVSNFIINPIFHIRSVLDARKIFEIVNKYDYSVMIDIDMHELTSLSAFRKVVEGQGNFIFEGNEQQWMKIRGKLADHTVFCDQVDNLGWQPQGFFAWANGIQTESEWIAIDENGVVEHKGIHYYIPAYSSIYIDDKSLFTEERKFKLVRPEISLENWSKLFTQVYGENGMVGMAFWTATLFRDYIKRIFTNFPILNLFGPTGTGKNQEANSLLCLFGEPQVLLNIHNSTKPGLADHLGKFHNGIAAVDEYKNSLPPETIETLKSIYDGIGRSRMNMDKKKKEITQVICALILLGQEMPTADIALFKRVVFLQFVKSEFSEKEKLIFDQLKAIEREGLSDFSNNLIQHRSYFEKEFYDTYQEVNVEFTKLLKDEIIEARIQHNWVIILSAFKTITAKVKVSFDYKALLPIGVSGCLKQNRQIKRSDEIGIFWETIEALFDENLITKGWHFKVQTLGSLKTKTREVMFNPPKDVLMVKYGTMYKAYAEHVRRMGIKPLPNDSLRFYLENHKTFLGVKKKTTFKYKEYDRADLIIKEHSVDTTAYCFDYEKLGINLQRESEHYEVPRHEKNGAPPADFTEPQKVDADEQKDLPF